MFVIQNHLENLCFDILELEHITHKYVGIHSHRENPNLCFYNQLCSTRTFGAYSMDIQLEWLVKILLNYDHISVVACDAALGTSMYKVSLQES